MSSFALSLFLLAICFSVSMGISSKFSKYKYYQDCIDFNEKETQLEKLKEVDKEEIETYINTVFTPNTFQDVTVQDGVEYGYHNSHMI